MDNLKKEKEKDNSSRNSEGSKINNVKYIT